MTSKKPAKTATAKKPATATAKPAAPAPDLAQVLAELETLMQQRKTEDARHSYAAHLLQSDEEALKKLLEEAGEVALAAMGGRRSRIVAEMADLFFHCIVVLARYNVPLQALAAELARRRGVSGVAEKSARAARRATAPKGDK